MRLKAIFIRLIVVLCLFVSFPVKADEENYFVKDNKTGLNEAFETLNEAISYYNGAVNKFDNLLLYENDKLIKMEYGIVKFTDSLDYIDYYSITKDNDDYLCARYGTDGAYLYSDNNDVYFKVSDDIGYTDISNVTLIPYEKLDVKVSLYHTDDQYLYHNIKTQLDYEYCSSSLKLDFIPDYLEKNHDYFSYDGHYFYDSFYAMIDDYNNETYENAINDEPYYNYYEYLPYRTITNHDSNEMEDYFYNTLKIDGRLVRFVDLNMDDAADEINRSQLYGIIDDFYVYQNIYGANALMLIVGAINESSYGKSYASFYNNNLYSLSAYDSIIETNNNRYDSISSSILSYAKYFVSNRFSNSKRRDYCGTFVGDRSKGITSTYSLDHYYGERFASTYFDLDNRLGLTDYNYYSIAVIDDAFNIYNDEYLSDYSYTIKPNTSLTFVILDELEDSYLIQLDDALNSNHYYDYEDNVGYISKDAVSYIINKDKYNDYEFANITYDFNGGTFNNEDSLTVKCAVGSTPINIEPNKDGYEFIGYDSVLEPVTGDLTYAANYRGINEISIQSLFNKQNDLYPSIDLNDASIIVKYEDGINKKLAINTDMLGNIDLDEYESQDVEVTYCGFSDTKTIIIDEEVSNIYKTVSDGIINNDFEILKANIDNISYPFTMSTIRLADQLLREKNNRNYVINDYTKKYNPSFSGLDLSLDDKSSLSFFKDTYYVEINDVVSNNYNKILGLANGYGFEDVCGINISFKFNFENIELNGPTIVQLDINDKNNTDIYSVYHLDKNGDIIKCRTTHSNNYVQFIINEEGDYLVLKKQGANVYNIDDSIENLSYENMGFDNHKFNLNVLFITVLVLISLIGIIIYYIIKNKKDIEWKDYRKSLQKADIVQEEKQKN